MYAKIGDHFSDIFFFDIDFINQLKDRQEVSNNNFDGMFLEWLVKEKIDGERWKIDVWFISEKEYEKRSIDERRMNNLTHEERTLILSCKEYRNSHKLSITGQEIYDAVLVGRWKSVENFKNETLNK